MTARQALQEARERLEAACVPDARLDARLLLAAVLDRPQLDVLATPQLPLNQAQAARFFEWVSRRAAREPLQYILGQAHFMGHAFTVRPGVLIPRSDSETLARLAIERAVPGCQALDLCCGSGALGISLKLARPDARVSACDISQQAVALTRENAQRLGAGLDLRLGDLFAPFSGQLFDLIVCNPPYVPVDELDTLQPEVRHEPPLALDGGADGLAFYQRIIAQAPAFLKPGGWLLLEVGDGQAKAVEGLLGPDFAPSRVHPDLAGLPRALETRRAGGVN